MNYRVHSRVDRGTPIISRWSSDKECWLSVLSLISSPAGPLIALLSPWTKETVETMRSIPRVYPCKLNINTPSFLLLFKREQGPISQKPWKRFGPTKPFLVSWYFICVKGTPVPIKNICIKQLCSQRGCEFCYSLLGEKTFGDLREMGPPGQGWMSCCSVDDHREPSHPFRTWIKDQISVIVRVLCFVAAILL